MIKRQMYGRATFALLPPPPRLTPQTVTTESATEPLYLHSRGWSPPLLRQQLASLLYRSCLVTA
jgi:hypothetical protein